MARESTEEHLRWALQVLGVVVWYDRQAKEFTVEDFGLFHHQRIAAFVGVEDPRPAAT
jgi:hypothetical protein